jgi:hypothetical protein
MTAWADLAGALQSHVAQKRKEQSTWGAMADKSIQVYGLMR